MSVARVVGVLCLSYCLSRRVGTSFVLGWMQCVTFAGVLFTNQPWFLLLRVPFLSQKYHLRFCNDDRVGSAVSSPNAAVGNSIFFVRLPHLIFFLALQTRRQQQDIAFELGWHKQRRQQQTPRLTLKFQAPCRKPLSRGTARLALGAVLLLQAIDTNKLRYAFTNNTTARVVHV